MLCGWGGNRRPGEKEWQPTAGWMTYGHVWCGLTACTLGSALGPTLGIEYGKTFTFFLYGPVAMALLKAYYCL